MDEATLNRLKALVTDMVWLDANTQLRAQMRFQIALYDKLFGKSPHFELVKAALLGLWKGFGNIQLSDMPNGYFVVWYATEETK